MNRNKTVIEFVKTFILDKDYRFRFLASKGFYKSMTDEAYLKRMYKACLGKELNLEHPETFNEKLQWLKLHNRKPEYSIMVDKYRVRRYITNTIGEQYLIPLLGVWDTPDEIDFDSLPNQFVLKCNHNSGLGMCICKDKTQLDIDKVKANLRKGLNNDYYYFGREWPYKDVPRKIVCEKYMTDGGKELSDYKDNMHILLSETADLTISEGLTDYKFFCFNGKVKFFKIDFNRFVNHQANYYNPAGNLLPFGEVDYPFDAEKKLNMPKKLRLMIELAEKLSIRMPFIRVDFYEVDGRVYFGELTFFPASGFGKIYPEEYDKEIGNLIDLT